MKVRPMGPRLAGALLFALAAPASAEEPQSLTVKEARASTAGAWRGELQYRDYQSNEWVGIPVSVTVEALGDGITLLRRSVYDDGPARGAVYITSLEMLDKDGTGEFATSFRAGRAPEVERAVLAVTSSRDTEHWTLVATREGRDDERPARIRETTVREGASLTTLKEIDFTDDAGETWLARNRVVLVRAE